MSDFFRGGRELPQWQSYARLIIQNKLRFKSNLIPSDNKESEGEELTSDEKNSYASYLASIIYDHQLKLKYASICLLTFLTMLSFDFAYAQETTKYEILPLQIGDTIPQAIWDMPLQVVNHPEGKDTIRLEDYRNKKLIILDFWATWCAPCVQSMDKWNKIYDENDNEILALGLHFGYKDNLSVYMQQRGWKIPSAYGDDYTLLNNYFFMKDVVSRIVWIFDKKVYAITGVKGYNQETISRLLNNEMIPLIMNLDYTYRKEGKQ